jgi:glycosyltransferase involved in cell wall biosynthesis
MLQYKLMNIAMDLTQIPADKTGIGIYALNLVREILFLNNTSNKFNIYFFAQDDDHEWQELINNSSSKQCHLIPIKSSIFRKLIFRLFFEQVLLPWKCKKLDIDAIYSFHYTMPYLTHIKRVVTIPDMTFYLFPELHQKIKRLYFKTLIPLSLKRCSRAITISASTKTDLLIRFPRLDPEKIAVIHLGVNISSPPVQAKEHLEKYGLQEKKYFLFVGTLEPRKNIPGIIEAFHQVITNNEHYKKDYKLVIMGKKGWFYREIFETVKKYHLEESVVFTGYLGGEAKQALLAHAFLFVYPSFYEGFGLPVLEAMAFRVPVITGNVSSLPEVSGDAALLIDPHHWQEIAAAMLKLLSDQELVKELSKRSLMQAQRFSWRHTAEKTLALFESLTIENE